MEISMTKKTTRETVIIGQPLESDTTPVKLQTKKARGPRKVQEPKKVEPELVSYSMKMVIPTGNYANIQPEIIVKAGTIEEAHNFIVPHMNKLWKEYYLIGERKKEEEVKPTQPVQPKSPISEVAFAKATQAIESCMSLEALSLIQKQIEDSVKLALEDKPKLLAISAARALILSKKLDGEIEKK